MKTVIEMAREAAQAPERTDKSVLFFGLNGEQMFRFHTLTRNATLDEIAKKIEAMPFGDTAASFAVWIREMKT